MVKNSSFVLAFVLLTQWQPGYSNVKIKEKQWLLDACDRNVDINLK